MVDTFIRRPILASVCSLVLILAGAVAIPTMPVAQYPALAPPQITVTAFYTGANAQEVETSVTTPLEQAINGVEGMSYMTSSSTNSGVSTINVTFDITRDQDLAQVDVQNRVNQTLGRMPAEVRTTGITVQKQSTGFVMAVGVYSEKGEYDSLFLSNYLDVYVKDALKRVPGVSDVLIFGERKYSMRLWLDPDRMAARNLTAGDVVSALREQNVQVAAGSLGQAPAPAGQMYQLSVRAVAGPRSRCRPRRARRRDLRRRPPLSDRPSRRLRRDPAAHRERARRRTIGLRGDGTAVAEFPSRGQVPGRVQHDRRCRGIDQ
jgi:HAE1 family hydrophobic/amphiphilic exporter-1